MWDAKSTRDSYCPRKPNQAKTWRLITDDFGEQVWRHRCPSCRSWLIGSQFYTIKGRPDGYCCECHLAHKRRRFREDEEYHRRILEERRLRYRLYREALGYEVNPKRGSGRLTFPVPKNPPMEPLPSAPLLEWLREKIKVYGFSEFATRCRISQRKLTSLLSKQYKTVTFGTVDEILTNEGSMFVWDMYPEQYEKMVST